MIISLKNFKEWFDQEIHKRTTLAERKALHVYDDEIVSKINKLELNYIRR